MSEENMIKIIFAYIHDLIKSIKIQIVMFVVCMVLFIFHDYFYLNEQFAMIINIGCSIIMIGLLVYWFVDSYIRENNNKKLIIKKLRNIVTNSSFYADDEGNNLLYVAYSNKLHKFSFDKICSYKEEMNINSDNMVEETLTHLCGFNIIQYKKGVYSFPTFVWKELKYFYNAKQLRKRLCRHY